jgi:hypothetical protein
VGTGFRGDYKRSRFELGLRGKMECRVERATSVWAGDHAVSQSRCASWRQAAAAAAAHHVRRVAGGGELKNDPGPINSPNRPALQAFAA